MSDRQPPPFDIERDRARLRPFTKIVATIGPASEDRVTELLEAGMSVARVNFSHGTVEDHRRRIGKIRAAAQGLMLSVGILADLPGPKMRTGTFAQGRVDLVEGELVRVRAGGGRAIAGEVLIDVPDVATALAPGHRVYLADGQVELVAQDGYGDTIVARVLRGGHVGDRKGVHLPDSDVHYELPTAEDRALIAFANDLGVEMLGVSFVGHASELREIRRLAPDALVIAKIERRVAIENLDELLQEADGIMVARGDLGVELELAQLPLVQKSMLTAGVRAGRFTITATEMLESMITSSRPTRAEVTDVANAVLDGTDAVMLSAETAVGEYPVASVRQMARIALAVEGSQRYQHRPRLKLTASDASFHNATAMAAVNVVNALGLGKIVCFTETGNTVRLISRYRPNAEIVALCPHADVVNKMTILAHVRAVLFRREPSLEDMLFMAAEMLVVRGICQYDEEIVFVAGVPPGVARSTNVMKLHRIGEEVKFS
jgi:pyruvate kinase